MKRSLLFLCIFALLLGCAVPASAAGGKVTYSGNSGKFIFAPGSEYSPTDLFPNFKDVMPGDTLSQPITVKNNASNKVKVKIYMRALGAHADSEEFLSQLHLQVKKSEKNTMAYMFDAAADETAQLSDWVLLGTLYSGGEVNLDVILDVPVTLDNRFQKEIGYLDWEFMIMEFPVESSDPQPPKTGDDNNIYLWTTVMIGSFTLLNFMLLVGKKKKKE